MMKLNWDKKNRSQARAQRCGTIALAYIGGGFIPSRPTCLCLSLIQALLYSAGFTFFGPFDFCFIKEVLWAIDP